MKRRFAMATGIAASAMLAGLISATPASAATLLARCNTTGASGGITVDDFNGATDKINFSMGVDDTLADGHHVRIRLITENAAGTHKYWSWHADYNGEGTSTEVNSYAQDDSGIFYVGIQVARFEGSTLLNSCTKWSTAV
ncbi:hypothetical protein [Streptomyces sp. AF1B]|jgi:hypothetical protein|uniref:hypothetical protein n=1 Tax=Streptomyces sp. AF1B TaxID=3399503 RepID=UPI003AAEC50D